MFQQYLRMKEYRQWERLEPLTSVARASGHDLITIRVWQKLSLSTQSLVLQSSIDTHYIL
jgi:hypothetical protein